MQSSVSNEIKHIEYLQEKSKYLKAIDLFEKSQYLLSHYPNSILNLDLNWNGDIKAKIYTKTEFHAHTLDKKITKEDMINKLLNKFDIELVDTKTLIRIFEPLGINIFPETTLKEFLDYLVPEFKTKFLYNTLQQDIPEKNIKDTKKPKI